MLELLELLEVHWRRPLIAPPPKSKLHTSCCAERILRAPAICHSDHEALEAKIPQNSPCK